MLVTKSKDSKNIFKLIHVYVSVVLLFFMSG